MVQLEHDRLGQDYSANLKVVNPGLSDGSGIFVASYLQSLTSKFALGAEVVYQKPPFEGPEDAALSYVGKYTGKDWIATGQLQASGILQATYWQKLAERIEAGVDLLISPGLGPMQKKAVTKAGVRYDFRQSCFRGQIDSQGKVAALLEHRLTPAFALLLSGEIDHWKVSFSLWGIKSRH